MSRRLHFFHNKSNHKKIYVIEHDGLLSKEYVEKLEYLTGSDYARRDKIEWRHPFVGTRRERITPFSTSATEIAHSIGLSNITRFEEYIGADSNSPEFDRMLQDVYPALDQKIFDIDRAPEPIRFIQDIRSYNKEHGLAISDEEIDYLESVAANRGHNWTDAELFGFSQANSEHCRHKIFNGTFIIDGEEQAKSLFQMIKETTIDTSSPSGYKGAVKNAYADNAAVIDSVDMIQWAPGPDGAMTLTPIKAGFILKAETHNHPTGVSPYPGAATGTGGEIRDRKATGIGSHPLAGTLVVMANNPESDKGYLYSSPQQILTDGTNGAFRFANEFGQPLINTRVFTFEHSENDRVYGYNKPILLAGGVGYVNEEYANKDDTRIKTGQRIILLGGPNYRVGIAGGSAASLDSGAVSKAVDYASVQRDNAEMENRSYRVTRALAESSDNPIISIHDHGAGGHFNCLVELVEKTGGYIDMSNIPVGDNTMSAREIISNESQERMAILVDEKDVPRVLEIAARECCPAYEIGVLTGDMKFVFEMSDDQRPVDMELKDILHNPPKTIMKDARIKQEFAKIKFDEKDFVKNLKNVLGMTSVGSKDWMTNKVDRSVTGKIAQQPCVGPLQLPVCKYGVAKFDFDTDAGIASAIGFAPAAAVINPAAASRLAIADAVMPLAFAPLKNGLPDIALSANWQWPCRNPGEDANLYDAVNAAAEFANALGVTIPTGKDSLSMTQTVDGQKITAPGTVVMSAAGIAKNLDKRVLPVIDPDVESLFVRINMAGICPPFELGGSAFATSLGFVGDKTPDIENPEYFKRAFKAVQEMVAGRIVIAGNSVSGGGTITALLEMAFPNTRGGIRLRLAGRDDISNELFSESPGVVVQVSVYDILQFEKIAAKHNIDIDYIGEPIPERNLEMDGMSINIDGLRDAWMTPSMKMEKFQNKRHVARADYQMQQPLKINVKKIRTISINTGGTRKTTCAVIRDKGVNGDREMGYAAKLGGFDVVKDVHMTDLMTGRENLKTADTVIFAGGFSNADALGAGKGWAAKFKYNARASDALMDFYNRGNTLILGVCNGCQVIQELGLIGGKPAPMRQNDSGKFESAFLSVDIPKNNAVMMQDLSGLTLPVWVAHGEGKFDLSNMIENKDYKVVMQYLYSQYPGNPNGSPGAVAGISSMDGRIVAMMPHPERSVLPYQWAWNPGAELYESSGRVVMPWLRMFAAANNFAKLY
ncbi:MAG: phosphoribosylformylglycinamidine synthase [Alphaproteobacteria bacterium]|nr:phosphoribosylformylglycinamidine synthase [Alphaproteobacteria bacterium]